MLIVVIILLIVILLQKSIIETFNNNLIPFTSGGWGGSKEAKDDPYETVKDYKKRLSKWISKEPMFNKEYHISILNNTQPIQPNYPITD